VTVRTRLFLAIPIAAVALGGCVAADGFPSLAQRPAERDVSIEEPVYPTVDVPSDPGLHARLADLQRQAAEGDRHFAAALGPAEAATARAGPANSESWIEAQQALSRLEAVREPTMRASRRWVRAGPRPRGAPRRGACRARHNGRLRGASSPCPRR
jgi:hypothetical protein